MTRWKPTLLKTLLDTLYAVRAHRLAGAVARGVGLIFTLHHVRSSSNEAAFAPNRILDITPDFLDETVTLVRREGYDIVSLDEAKRRLAERDFATRFACFTLDDGYADNLSEAAPVFERHDVPFCVYVTTSMPDGEALLWWEHLENIVASHEEVGMRIGGDRFDFASRTTAEKYAAFNALYWRLRAAPVEQQQDDIMRLLEHYKLDPTAPCRNSALDWDELARLSAHPRCTIGAHTVSHQALSKLDENAIVKEIEECRRVLTQRLDTQVRHFCYPFGDAGSAGPREFALLRECGFDTATTTRKGVLFPEHADHLHALPRVSLNGDYQRERYVTLFMSGAPFALQRGFRRLDVH